MVDESLTKTRSGRVQQAGPLHGRHPGRVANLNHSSSLQHALQGGGIGLTSAIEPPVRAHTGKRVAHVASEEDYTGWWHLLACTEAWSENNIAAVARNALEDLGDVAAPIDVLLGGEARFRPHEWWVIKINLCDS